MEWGPLSSNFVSRSSTPYPIEFEMLVWAYRRLIARQANPSMQLVTKKSVNNLFTAILIAQRHSRGQIQIQRHSRGQIKVAAGI